MRRGDRSLLLGKGSRVRTRPPVRIRKKYGSHTHRWFHVKPHRGSPAYRNRAPVVPPYAQKHVNRLSFLDIQRAIRRNQSPALFVLIHLTGTPTRCPQHHPTAGLTHRARFWPESCFYVRAVAGLSSWGRGLDHRIITPDGVGPHLNSLQFHLRSLKEESHRFFSPCFT